MTKIEAHRVTYGKLRRNRPNAININCALCDVPKVLHYVQSKLGSVAGIYEFMSPNFVKTWHPEIAKGRVKIKDLPKVACFPVGMVLTRLHITHIDLWVLDVEGAELSILNVSLISR